MKTVALCALAVLAGCSSANLEEGKKVSAEVWRAHGFEVVAYEGYKWCKGFGAYGGACVWSRLKKIPDNGVTYSGYIQRWGDEWHVYGPLATEVYLTNGN